MYCVAVIQFAVNATQSSILSVSTNALIHYGITRINQQRFHFDVLKPFLPRAFQCFSLLGLNGAGKTTTFRCLTGDLRPSRGQILINGIVLNEALSLPRPVMSYCPQNDPLDPNITPREALFIMALVRGFRDEELVEVSAPPRVPGRMLACFPILFPCYIPRTSGWHSKLSRPSRTEPLVFPQNVDRAIKQLGLTNHEHSYIRYLSGGTMRKVSLALALIGNPPLVLLDEPTT